ncbi:tetratricopeptide repeat protein [Sulfurimonas sp.]
MKKLFLMLVLLSSMAYASTDTAFEAFNKGDYKTAFSLLEAKAKKGNINATYNLSLMYYNGLGVEQNISKAAKLLEIAAKAGHKKAVQNVGRIYMQLMKFNKAKQWLQKNAKMGDTGAYYLLAEIYIVQEKFKKAKKWAKKAMEAGDKEASVLWQQYNLQKY